MSFNYLQTAIFLNNFDVIVNMPKEEFAKQAKEIVSGFNALMIAIITRSSRKCIQMLIAVSDLKYQNRDGNNALMLMLHYGNPTDRILDEFDKLVLAGSCHHVNDILDEMRSKSDLTQRNKFGQSYYDLIRIYQNKGKY